MDWQGLFKWSIQTQGDHKADTTLQPLSKDEKAWLEEALKDYNVDVVG